LAAGVSAGLAAFVAVYLLVRDRRFSLPRNDVQRLIENMQRKSLKRKDDRNRVYLNGGCAGALAVILIAQGKVSPGGLVLGAIFGAGAAHVYQMVAGYSARARRMREAALLYLLVEMGLKSGYSLPQSLRSASVMVPGLSAHLERCLEVWPKNPIEALEYLRLAINLPEADAFVTVLMQVQDMGAGRLHGALEEGSRQLNNLMRALVRSQAAGKPLAFSIFRLLPLVGCLGIVLGPLVYQIIDMVKVIFDVFS
jgi:hypothetical protein